MEILAHSKIMNKIGELSMLESMHAHVDYAVYVQVIGVNTKHVNLNQHMAKYHYCNKVSIMHEDTAYFLSHPLTSTKLWVTKLLEGKGLGKSIWLYTKKVITATASYVP